MSRSILVRVALAAIAVAAGLSMAGCLGKRSFFAGRTFPPSTILQRVLVAIQNPSPLQEGALQIVDARYDIRNSENGFIPSFPIGGYTGKLPTLIDNYPEQQVGYVYGAGDGSFQQINYSSETQAGTIGPFPGASSSVTITPDGSYAFAANQQSQYVTVVDRVQNINVSLNLPNVYKVAANPSGSVALAFVQNSNYAYRILHLQQPGGKVMPVPTFPNEANWPANVSPVDCQPVNLPLYCVAPVVDQSGMPIAFDRPYNTIFSSDGTTAWVLNCGPECGGQQASVSYLNIGVLDVYNFPGSTYPSPPPAQPPPTERARVPVPGGATMAVYRDGKLYVSGQQIQPDGLLEGFMSIVNLSSNKVIATYPISDGTHTKMLFADDNTLWIGSQLCQTGERTAKNLGNGCLTMFNMNDNSVLVEKWYGDLTGLCAIVLWHKVYTAYGGQIHIYATTDHGITTSPGIPVPIYKAGSELPNANVTVRGTAYDVAYMDAISNAQD